MKRDQKKIWNKVILGMAVLGMCRGFSSPIMAAAYSSPSPVSTTAPAGKDVINATSITVDGSECTVTFNGNSHEDHYLSMQVPQGKTNEWIQITMTNKQEDGKDNSGHDLTLQNNSGQDLQAVYAGVGESNSIICKLNGDEVNTSNNEPSLSVGEKYRIKVSSYSYWTSTNSVSVKIKSIQDDCYGTADSNAKAITLGASIDGKLEVYNDIDCYRFESVAGKEYQFSVASNSSNIEAALIGADKVEIKKIGVGKHVSWVGTGGTVYIKVQSETIDMSANDRKYTVSVTGKNGQTVNTKDDKATSGKKASGPIRLLQYKRGTKIVIGKILGQRTITLNVEGKTYIKSVAMKGKFKIKLKKKLKKGTKIVIITKGKKSIYSVR